MAGSTSHHSTAVATGEAFLKHHGVKGMKWGVRRAEKRAARPGGGKDASGDAVAAVALKNQGRNSGRDSLSNKELQDLVTRWNLEQSYDRLRPRTVGEKAGRFIAQQLVGIGKEQAQKYVREQVGVAIKKRQTADA